MNDTPAPQETVYIPSFSSGEMHAMLEALEEALTSGPKHYASVDWDFVRCHAAQTAHEKLGWALKAQRTIPKYEEAP